VEEGLVPQQGVNLGADDVRVYFVRHGEVHNPGAIFYGRLPRFRLSEEGRRQAAAAARDLAAEPLAAVYTSPLLRARQTGAIIAARHPGAPIRRSAHILELRSRRQGEPVAGLDADRWNFYEPPKYDDDETIAQIAARIERFCRGLLRRHPGRAVAAVSHGDVVAIARARFAGLPLVLDSIRGEYYPATASILRVTLGPNLAVRDLHTWRPEREPAPTPHAG
jgi:broad specificity phosphatase PhoE